MEHDYEKEFKEFISSFQDHPVSGFEAGELIVRMANYYSDYNLAMVEAIRGLSNVRKDFETSTDAGGKILSSTKAEVFADATQEAHVYQVARAHVQNLEQIINSLKALQKAVMVDYNNASLN